jgi:hypothetical protein
MADMIDDGGPAFPSAGYNDMHGDHHPPVYGMSLRDWFAGQALAGMLSPERRGGGGSESSNSVRAISRDAYLLADAMLAARSKHAK